MTEDNITQSSPFGENNNNTGKKKKTVLIAVIASLLVVAIAVVIVVMIFVPKKEENAVSDVNVEEKTEMSTERETSERQSETSPAANQNNSPVKEEKYTYTIQKNPEELKNIIAAGSSIFPEQEEHFASTVLDGNLKTAWVEGVSKEGIGEYLELRVPKGTIITNIDVAAGFYKSEELFKANAAPTILDFTIGNSTYTKDISAKANQYDESNPWSKVTFENVVAEDGTVRIIIKGTRPGTLYEDTCISEVKIFGILPDSYLNKKNNIDQYYSQTKNDNITVSMEEVQRESAYIVSKIRAKDNNTQEILWEIQTDFHNWAQYTRCNGLFVIGDLYFYEYYEDMICIDIYTGDVMWISKNTVSYKNSYKAVYNSDKKELYIASDYVLNVYDLYGNVVKNISFNKSSGNYLKNIEHIGTDVVITLNNDKKVLIDTNTYTIK